MGTAGPPPVGLEGGDPSTARCPVGSHLVGRNCRSATVRTARSTRKHSEPRPLKQCPLKEPAQLWHSTTLPTPRTSDPCYSCQLTVSRDSWFRAALNQTVGQSEGSSPRPPLFTERMDEIGEAGVDGTAVSIRRMRGGRHRDIRTIRSRRCRAARSTLGPC
jgi:hypothetical protein